MRLYSEDNKRVTEAVYGRKYKLRVGVNNLDSTYESLYLIFSFLFFFSPSFILFENLWKASRSACWNDRDRTGETLFVTAASVSPSLR